MPPNTKMEAITLIDYMSLPSCQRKHGADNCEVMIRVLRSHLLAATPEQNEPALVEDIKRVIWILGGKKVK